MDGFPVYALVHSLSVTQQHRLGEWCESHCSCVVIPGESPELMEALALTDYGPPFEVHEFKLIDQEQVDGFTRTAARGKITMTLKGIPVL